MQDARTWAAAVLWSALALGAGAARAQAPEPETSAEQDLSARRQHAREGSMAPRGWFGMVGANLAFNFAREPGSGVTFGAEGSLARITPELFWAGAYLDALLATEAEELRLSLGPEIGYGWAGVDVGYVLALGFGGSAQHGFAVRPLITFGVAAIYFRSISLFGPADWSGEVGLLLKLPIEL